MKKRLRKKMYSLADKLAYDSMLMTDPNAFKMYEPRILMREFYKSRKFIKRAI